MNRPVPGVMRTLTILAPSFALMSVSALSPALGKIAQAFPELSVSAVQLLCTIPSLVGFPLILLSGRLARVFTKKQILSVSLGLMLAGGLLPLLAGGGYPLLVIASVLYGVGFGGISPMTTALIHEHCPPERQAGMMGLQSAAIGIGGVFFSYLGGILANVGWRYSYLAFLLLAPVLLLTLCLPKGSVARREKGRGGLMSPGFAYYLGHGLLLNCFIGVFLTNISMLVQETGLGGAETAGSLTALYSVAGIVGGLAAGRLIGRLGRYMLGAITMVCALGMLALWHGGGMAPVLLGTSLLGAMYAMRMPAGYTGSIRMVPEEGATMAISLYCCFAQLGNFLSPLVIQRLSPGDAAPTRFLTAGVLLGGLTLIAFGREIWMKRIKDQLLP